MTRNPEAGPPIVCPVSGRTWPRSQPLGRLKDCACCGGKIDTRHEAWSDRPGGAVHAVCPLPPPAPAAPPSPRPRAEAADPAPRDNVHHDRLEELRVSQLASANGRVA